MKQFHKIILGATLAAAALVLCSATPQNGANSPLKISVVNFKTCVELSKMGKQEQASFEAMKKQMETALEEKEKVINEIAQKSQDPDYLDSLTPEAETELKRKFRALSQEITGLQNQYYQALSQANVKIVQKLSETVAKASAKVAKDNKIDIVLNEEASFFYSPDLDISSKVVAVMDQIHEQESKEAKEKSATSGSK